MVQCLGLEDPLEREMAPHSSILAWEIPWTEEPGGLQSKEPQRVGHDCVYTPPYLFIYFCLHWVLAASCRLSSWSVGLVAPRHMRILIPQPWIKSVSPEFGGRFLTTGP